MSAFDPNRPPAAGPEWRTNGRASDIPIEPGGEPSPFANPDRKSKPGMRCWEANGQPTRRIRRTISAARSGPAGPGKLEPRSRSVAPICRPDVQERGPQGLCLAARVPG